MHRLILSILLLTVLSLPARAQIERERAPQENIVSDTFWTPGFVVSRTVEQIPADNLNVTIMHTFGVVSNRTLPNFFGLDSAPNVRLGIDYGLTDRWSLGIGRTTFEKVVDLRSKFSIVQQEQNGGTPVSVGVSAGIAVTTRENGRPFGEDLSGFGGLMVARKFSDRLSVQVTPGISRFATPLPGNDEMLATVAVGTEFRLNRRFALFGEYLPVIGSRNEQAHNPFAVGLNIETGGHVFQLFFSSSNWHLEPYALSHTNTDFGAGDFRFGFNVNRIFGS